MAAPRPVFCLTPLCLHPVSLLVLVVVWWRGVGPGLQLGELFDAGRVGVGSRPLSRSEGCMAQSTPPTPAEGVDLLQVYVEGQGNRRVSEKSASDTCLRSEAWGRTRRHVHTHTCAHQQNPAPLPPTGGFCVFLASAWVQACLPSLCLSLAQPPVLRQQSRVANGPPQPQGRGSAGVWGGGSPLPLRP